MIVRNPDLLAYVRTQPCAFCAAPPPSDPHHIICRGMGGGSRLDVPLNLIPLCRIHHQNVQVGGPLEAIRCLNWVADQNGLESWEVVQEALWHLLRRKK